MKNSCLDLLGFANVPEILSEVSAGSSSDVHLVVILVATLRAFPLTVIVDDDLTVISAHMAVI